MQALASAAVSITDWPRASGREVTVIATDSGTLTPNDVLARTATAPLFTQGTSNVSCVGDALTTVAGIPRTVIVFPTVDSAKPMPVSVAV